MDSKNAIDFHNDRAIEFDSRYELSKAFQERFHIWTALFERYITATDQVIDLGCGSGIFSNYLAKKGCIVTGIDGSEAMIALCKQKRTSTMARFAVGNLPLKTLTHFPAQDVVIMSSILEYLNDMTGMLEQARLLLKPNGLLLVSIPNRRSLYRKVERQLFRLLARPVYYRYIRNTATETTFNRQLTESGFTPVETGYFSGQDPISRVLKPFLAAQYVNNLLVGVFRKTPALD
ncbi:class I SAM-dependent methyltransferase [Spirosoma spitsbergense]|uniref:class I SAM-dependent methyltransferase n=1 Tax=Spirosoma spitsbergense TaxID=431554 RepID=UPI000361C3C0|nr:class I SAM-dependent methyltransferase [Spirosoma spitsbergense]